MAGKYMFNSYMDEPILIFVLLGRRKMAQCVIKDHFGHVTPNRFDMKMAAKPGVTGGNSWTGE